jgi:ABC-type antimicrobial peptide transport system permease subunit
MSFYLRSSLEPGALVAAVPPVVARLDRDLPVDELRTMPAQVRENVAAERLISTLSASFALLATLLAGVGLYGVLAYTVSQRTRELGLRMALGADAGRVRRLVLAQVGRMTLIGGALGLAGALALGRLARSMLFQLEGHDPVVLAAAVAALAGVAFLAGWVPAWRASRVDPMTALRWE